MLSPLYVESLRAFDDPDAIEAENTITDWRLNWNWFEDEEGGWYELIITSRYDYSEVAENLTVIPRMEGAEVEFDESDKDGYEGKVIITVGDRSRTYYIKYEIDEDYMVGVCFVRSIRTNEDGGEEHIATGWGTDYCYYDDDEEAIHVLEIYGQEDFEEVVKNLEIVPANPDAEISELEESDIEGYAAKFTISCDDMSRVWYISYIQD